MPGLIIEGAPAAEPVSLDEAKSHMRVTISDDDALIGIYLQAARQVVEGFLGRSLINKRYVQSHDNFPYYVDASAAPQAYPPANYTRPGYASTLWNYTQQIKLSRSPVVKVSRITYVATDQTIKTLYPSLEFSPWAGGTEYKVGSQILDPNGNVEQVTAVVAAQEDGTSESACGPEPTWATEVGQTVTDGNLTWRCEGPPPGADFYLSNNREIARVFPSLTRNAWPAALYVPDAVKIHFTAGYGTDGASVPAHFRLAVLILAAGYYEFREPVSALLLRKIPEGIERLLWNDRIVDLAPTPG